MKTLEKLLNHLNDQIDSSNRKLAEFTKNFESDPDYAFRWAKESFQAAANLAVCKSIKGWVEANPDATVANVKSEVEEQALRGALYPEFSTSPTSSLMATYRLQAWAELAQKMK